MLSWLFEDLHSLIIWFWDMQCFAIITLISSPVLMKNHGCSTIRTVHSISMQNFQSRNLSGYHSLRNGTFGGYSKPPISPHFWNQKAGYSTAPSEAHASSSKRALPISPALPTANFTQIGPIICVRNVVAVITVIISVPNSTPCSPHSQKRL